MQRVIGFKERRYIEELRILTKSTALDCVIDDSFDRAIYIIKKGDMGFAIGRNGENIKKLHRILGKRVEMVEESESLEDFLKNVFKPAAISGSGRADESGKILVYVDNKTDLGKAIGKGGCNIEKARLLVLRYFGDEVGDIILN
ncbi:NusA-like transcription termination signal-binding factor [Methanolacinia petrolearia]|uniref:NusA-like transcription termination signal-binding factor n=1 Tax=Methanolacinia petrolearia TaxID=54120 RepID=UPI003BAC2BD7